jgi:hypothetical protein
MDISLTKGAAPFNPRPVCAYFWRHDESPWSATRPASSLWARLLARIS